MYSRARLTGVLIDPDAGFCDEITISDQLNRYKDVLKCSNPVFPEMYLTLFRCRVACDYDMNSKHCKASALDENDNIVFRGPLIIFGERNGNLGSLSDDEITYVVGSVQLGLVRDGGAEYVTYCVKPISDHPPSISTESVPDRNDMK